MQHFFLYTQFFLCYTVYIFIISQAACSTFLYLYIHKYKTIFLRPNFFNEKFTKVT
jgi:hypothetical protein